MRNSVHIFADPEFLRRDPSPERIKPAEALFRLFLNYRGRLAGCPEIVGAALILLTFFPC